MSGPRAVTGRDLSEIREAIRMLHVARGRLKGAGSVRAAAAVTRAIKSAQGAERHAEGLVGRALRAEGAATVRELARQAEAEAEKGPGECPCGHETDGGGCELAQLEAEARSAVGGLLWVDE